MGLSRGGAGVPSEYSAVSDAMEYEQTTTVGSYGSLGGENEPHGSTYLSMQTHPTVVPSFFHFGAGFFDTPGFGERGAVPASAPVPAPVGGGYGGSDMVRAVHRTVDGIRPYSHRVYTGTESPVPVPYE